MQTITFFSYKGGTGRSLAVANAACYLSQLGFKVAVLDFDLEAPGMHYKFSTAMDGSPVSVSQGVVDYLFNLIIKGERPERIIDYVAEVQVFGGDYFPVFLLPAGKVPSVSYWERLSQLDWHALFYAPNAKGVELFLDFKGRIEEELAPDFLLIDTRTGVTEMGGIATTILPDAVVCLLLYNRENLEGARAVLRSLKRSLRQNMKQQVKLVAAVSRLPESDDYEVEHRILDQIKSFLIEPAEDLEDTLDLNEIFVLHSEPALQLRESLRVGKGMSLDDSILLRDYLRLFSQIVPGAMIEPRIGGLLQSAREMIWSDPEGATQRVNELAEFWGHPQGYIELLRFYVIRNIRGEPALKLAERYWELTHDAGQPFLQALVGTSFKEVYQWGSDWKPNLDFIDNVWSAGGKGDATLGRNLAKSYDNFEKPGKAADIYLQLIEINGDAKQVGRCIDLLLEADRPKEAERLIERFKDSAGSEPEFISAWAGYCLKQDHPGYLETLSQEPFISILLQNRPDRVISVLRRTGKQDTIERYASRVRSLLGDAIQERDYDQIREIAIFYSELGRLEEILDEIKRSLPAEFVYDVLREVRYRRL
ncbi:MAG TPA: hypothetical protein VEF34_10320 [Syntrophobacteraceae bacterium]|nr:hypothetical protein [Syntrophobacteraceae bacterium]